MWSGVAPGFLKGCSPSPEKPMARLASGLLLGALCAARGHSQSAGPDAQCASEARSLRVVLVRHAESFNNVLNLVSSEYYADRRLADPPITALGEEQAAAAARFVSESRSGLLQQISELRVSPTLRTLQTARPISAALPGVSTLVDLEIYEVGGVYNTTSTGEPEGQPGLPRAEMAAYGHALPDEALPGGWYPVARGKESKAEGAARAGRVAARLRAEASALSVPRKTVALVSHGDFISNLLAELLGKGAWAEPGGALSFKARSRAQRRGHCGRGRAAASACRAQRLTDARLPAPILPSAPPAGIQHGGLDRGHCSERERARAHGQLGRAPEGGAVQGGPFGSRVRRGIF